MHTGRTQGIGRPLRGVPEGDPLSVVAMFCMCRFFALWVKSKGQVLPLTYADNWQVLADKVEPVLRILPAVETFLLCVADFPGEMLAVECL